MVIWIQGLPAASSVAVIAAGYREMQSVSMYLRRYAVRDVRLRV
jgi:hypothetical protein